MPLQLVDPFRAAPLAEFPLDSIGDVERKLERARTAQRAWSRVPLAERVREVQHAVRYFETNLETIASDVTRQMGKPVNEARGEVKTLLARAKYMGSVAEEALAPVVVPGKPGFTLRIEHAPLGVVLDIASWNYPLIVPVNVVVPALLAGNAVLLKHSPLTPLAGAHFERAFEGLSIQGLVQNVVLTNADTEHLVADPRVDYVSFTGSVATGKRVYAAASRRVVDVGLELGGKDPAYVADDGDLDFAAANVVDGACYNAGQSCCAVERAYVHHSIYGAFLAKAKAAMEAYVLGDPMAETTTMGPIAREEQLALLERHVQDALQRGARLVTGGKRPAHLGGWFFEPTLLADVPNDALVMQEETFGPILPIARVMDDDDALARMNDSRFGLTASVWTKSAARAERFARELQAGTVYQNRCDYLDPALPWTGWKESGIGSTLSRFGFAAFTHKKSIHFRG
ncbi:MAG: aldehyde dehydrogenase family protein [Planctomycetes bacterium]|nr:aldehyde dehydrogenase family protein [Planctomycetota bacterium]